MDFDPRPVFTPWRAARGDEVEVVVISEAEHDMTLPGGNISPEYERTLVGSLISKRFGHAAEPSRSGDIPAHWPRRG
jgi:hypothetical protein